MQLLQGRLSGLLLGKIPLDGERDYVPWLYIRQEIIVELNHVVLVVYECNHRVLNVTNCKVVYSLLASRLLRLEYRRLLYLFEHLRMNILY